ncbi:sensor histidine kinase [Polluticaenibacter yanchengensis]|uniref:histidine kinase n=1 Tax=Polluticaenibacter yanchengensis TaxID=3014562 RepID=A0ABT4UP00_9BACT|nr:histidine kinase [Chitinophagaceae bacterium LY-5]
MDPKEKELLVAILIATLLVVSVLIAFIAVIIRQQAKYRKLAQQKLNAEILTLENERRRVASDLHDEVGPILSAIKLQISNIKGRDDSDIQIIEKAGSHLNKIILNVREVSNNLMPNVLLRKGLDAAIYDFIQKFENTSKLKIEFKANENIRYSQNTEVNIYRIVQEIVHNAVKHSQATELIIALKMEPNAITLSTQDNGIGFKQLPDAKNGLGLINLQSRSDILKAVFSSEIQRGKGTKYLFEIPID